MTDVIFNAKDAAKLSSLHDPKELLQTILNEIKEKCLQGEWVYTTRSYGFGDGILYDVEQNYPERIRIVLNELRKLGFQVQIHTIENQFVDIYLHVTWKDYSPK